MSTGIKFLYSFSLGAYDPLNPGVNIVSVTGTASGDFSSINLTSTPLREMWRSAAINVVQRIVIQANDLTDPIDVFAILNHNFSEDAVITLEANTTNSFAAPPFTRTLTWNEKHIVLSETVSTAYEYWRLSILDTGNACGYLQIGRIVGGTSLTLLEDEDITDDISIAPDDLAYQMKSEGFFRASNERVQVDKVQIRFDKLKTSSGDDTNYRALKEMFKEVGTTMPFLTIVDPADVYFELIWGQFDNMPSRSYGTNRYVTTTLAIQEVF